VIRPFGLRDLATIKQLEPLGLAFDLRRTLLDATVPSQAALWGYLTRSHLGALTCIHEDKQDRSQLKGFAQVWPGGDRCTWELAYLAPSLDYHQRVPEIWQRLLSHLLILGAQQGKRHIYARLAEDAEAETILRQAGFNVISREEVFVLSQEVSPAPQPKGLRPVTGDDLGPLQEFYGQVMPPVVQATQGFPAHWLASTQRHLWRAGAVNEFIWSEKGKVVAYLGLSGSARGAWLEVFVRPEYRGDVLPHIRYVLALSGCSATRPVYCPIPDHTVGLGWLLRTLGFSSYVRQVVLVAHNYGRVPVRQKMVVAGLERTVDVGRSVGHAYHVGMYQRVTGSVRPGHILYAHHKEGYVSGNYG